MEPEHIIMRPVGVIRAERAAPTDDRWGGAISTIMLDPAQFAPECTLGLKEFSHLEVVFFMHLVPPDTIETAARHPRGCEAWPRVGIFAQRAKDRPNRIGLSRCRIASVDGLTIVVEGLDAVDGTPVLDVKPYMREFGPRGALHQPAWAGQLMEHYYDP